MNVTRPEACLESPPRTGYSLSGRVTQFEFGGFARHLSMLTIVMSMFALAMVIMPCTETYHGPVCLMLNRSPGTFPNVARDAIAPYERNQEG